MDNIVTLYTWDGCNKCKYILEYFTEHRMGTVVHVGQGNDGDFEKVSPKRIVPALSVTNSSGQIVKKTVGYNSVSDALENIVKESIQEIAGYLNSSDLEVRNSIRDLIQETPNTYNVVMNYIHNGVVPKVHVGARQ